MVNQNRLQAAIAGNRDAFLAALEESYLQGSRDALTSLAEAIKEEGTTVLPATEIIIAIEHVLASIAEKQAAL